MKQNDLVEFGDKGLRSVGLVIHISGRDKNTTTTKIRAGRSKNSTCIQIYSNMALLFKLQSYVTSEDATKIFLGYLKSLDENILITILSKKQIMEIKELLYLKSLQKDIKILAVVSEKLRYLQSTLQHHETLNDLLDGEPKEPYTTATLNVCCHWNDSLLAQQNHCVQNATELIVELDKFLPPIKDPFSCEESLAFF